MFVHVTPHAAPAKPTIWDAIKPWIDIQELPKHLANILPFLLGTVLAYWEVGTLNWAVFWVSIVALYFLTNGTYIGNEYFDYENDRALDDLDLLYRGSTELDDAFWSRHEASLRSWVERGRTFYEVRTDDDDRWHPNEFLHFGNDDDVGIDH